MGDFTGFRFGNIHTKDLHLTVVSSSSRYNKNLLPAPTDYKDDVPGNNGSYYYGQTFGNRDFTVNVAFDSVDEPTWRRISQIFSTDKLKDLVFDENPYKTYRAKLRSAPDFKFVCFTDRKTGQRIYKGEGTFNFICYHPLAYCFNKYVVRAAAYYKCTQPEFIINKDSINTNLYTKLEKPKMLNGLIKDHYNVTPNMNTPWKGGYPTIEQVQWGELYFNDKDLSDKEKKLIIETRGYWDNIPKWECAAKLLTTPTLDYEQELIYMPQYSRVNYYNMDIGLNKQNGLIGSRILVYNPGDVPVDFELRLGNLISHFRKLNKGIDIEPYKFRVSRYNVQRMSIEDAVDLTGLKTRNRDEEETYKYGKRYVDILEGLDENSDTNQYAPRYHNLINAHPNHVYMVEPVPREHLAHFIKLFYWQSTHGDVKPEFKDNVTFTYEQGIEIANRYQELYDECITEEEKQRLYWETLDIAILSRYNDLKDVLSDDYTFENFKQDYLFNPPEYIRKRTGEEVFYGEFDFNLNHIPGYYTFDYLDINSNGFETIQTEDKNNIVPLFLDFEKRMLYNINEPEVDFSEEDDVDVKIHNYYNYKPTKQIFNDNIEQGHWFQLPPGWSLIDVSPIVNEDNWGGKRWLDGRPFKWGTTNEDFRNEYNKIYEAAAREYIPQRCPYNELVKETYLDEIKANGQGNLDKNDLPKNPSAAEVKTYLQNCNREDLEQFLQFRKWYPQEDYKNNVTLNKEINKSRVAAAEYGFLKTLADFWRVKHLNGTDKYAGDIDTWWWYANSYIWHNFPPLYWGYADLLNQLQIKYVPQYY